jgi:hypothetical protein
MQASPVTFEAVGTILVLIVLVAVLVTVLSFLVKAIANTWN